LRRLAEARQWYRVRIESGLLESLALWGEGAPGIERALEHAFALAETAGFVQVLADEREVLSALPESVMAAALSASGHDFRTRLERALGAGAAPAIPATPAGELVEPLSAREIEVLRAIASGATNAEAGEKLCISPRTVKKHLENIYGKLDVHNRVEAIERARSAGIFGSDGSK
ncbi:MAG: LuxR C-terminal-related transcriptional regulator, partial [Holophagales bacterium]|nr:LuxR C-terminal-related transcriptional regulator [Holophagales bacterium]